MLISPFFIFVRGIRFISVIVCVLSSVFYLFSSWGNLPLQSYWSTSCDHELHCSHDLMWQQQQQQQQPYLRRCACVLCSNGAPATHYVRIRTCTRRTTTTDNVWLMTLVLLFDAHRTLLLLLLLLLCDGVVLMVSKWSMRLNPEGWECRRSA